MSHISPEQSRAARAWLDWSQEDLAQKAQVSMSTVRDFEKGRRTPIANNLGAMQAALEKAGITLVFDENGRARGITRLDDAS
jgi:ribosome-binding protein aMBF1 (putative translation factor)